MSEPPRILLEHRLKTLKLPTFLREYEKVARESAQEGLDHVQFLSHLVELELIDRERRLVERRIKAARFPTVKSLDSFEFNAIPSVNKAQVLELARCEWIERRENVIALGPSGTGKSHVAQPETPVGLRPPCVSGSRRPKPNPDPLGPPHPHGRGGSVLLPPFLVWFYSALDRISSLGYSESRWYGQGSAPHQRAACTEGDTLFEELRVPARRPRRQH